MNANHPRRTLPGFPALMLGAVLTGLTLLHSPALAAEAAPQSPSAAAPNPAARKVNVEVLTLTPQSLSVMGTYVGDLQPNERVVLRSEIDGLIERVTFDTAHTVKKGQVLANIATDQATVRRDQAKVNLELAKANAERNQALFEKQLIPPQALDDTRTALEVARLNLQAAEIELRKSMIRSPIDGTVKTRHVSQGEFAQKGGLVAEVLDVRTLVAKINVPEREIAFFLPGKRMSLALDSLAGKVFPGKVKTIGPEADSKSRSFPVEVEVDNKDGALRAGMLARVKAELIAEASQVVIPRGAVLERERGREAYVEAKGQAELRPIELGFTVGDRVQVTSGLKAGDRLIVLGHKALTPGEAVHIVRETAQAIAGR